MAAKLHKLAQLGPEQWRGLAAAYLYLLLAGWRLFVCRERLDRWLMGQAGAEAGTPLTLQERNSLASRARWVNAAARHPLPWARCLQRSLALCLWMERRRFQPQLRIGVRKEGGALLAHAWVEYRGEVINDSGQVLKEFAPLSGVNGGQVGVPGEERGRWI